MIQIKDYLDAKEERYKYIEQIKDRLLELESEIYEIESHLQDYHSELRNKIKKRVEYCDEVCLRIQDYHTFLYDFKKDWNLNYEYENN